MTAVLVSWYSWRRRSGTSATYRVGRSISCTTPTSSTARTRAARARSSAHTTSPTRGRLRALHEHNEARPGRRGRSSGAGGRPRRADQRRGHTGYLGPRKPRRGGGRRSRTRRHDGAGALGRDRGPLDQRTVDASASSWRDSYPARLGDRAQRYDAVVVRGAHDRVLRVAPAREAPFLASSPGATRTRRVAVARELTKVHEEVIRGSLQEVAAALGDRDVLGEIVVVLEGGSPLAEIDRRAVTRGAARAVREAARRLATRSTTSPRRLGVGAS